MKFLKEMIKKKSEVALNADPEMEGLEPLQRRGPRAEATNVTHIAAAKEAETEYEEPSAFDRDDQILAALNSESDDLYADDLSAGADAYDPADDTVVDAKSVFYNDDDDFDDDDFAGLDDTIETPDVTETPQFEAPVAPPEQKVVSRPPAEPIKNIWDLEPEEDAVSEDTPDMYDAPPTIAAQEESTQAETPAPAVGRAGRRAGRVKTRLLGFNPTAGAGTDPFDNTEPQTDRIEAKFPVGWIVITKGPGLGTCFTLFNGVSQIGRGEEQAIRLDFGDNSVSRENHAAIAYDSEQGVFFLGQGGKANIVRLNNRPVLSTEELSNADLIRIGETTLRFVALCSPDFDWEKTYQEETQDAAIA